MAKKVHPRQKWDYEKINALYLSGMTIKAICDLEAFQGLSPTYLQKHIYANDLHNKRRDMLAMRGPEVSKQVQQAVLSEIEIHHKFMLSELQRERSICVRREHSNVVANQKARLSLLGQIDEMARKVLGITGDSIDQQKRGFQVMINLHGMSQEKMAQAVTVVPQEKNVTTELVGSNTGNVVEFPIAEQATP